MYGLNAFALMMFMGINLIARQLCLMPSKTHEKALRILCAALLAGNLIRYGAIHPFVLHHIEIPVEFSSVAYFAVPFALLFCPKRMRSWAAYSGLMAGFFYYMAMIAAGGRIYGANAPVDVYISMLCHGSVYLCGFVTIGTKECDSKDAPLLILGVLPVAVRAALLRPFVAEQRLLIYILLDGTPLKVLLNESVGFGAMIAYYAALSLLILISIRGFFRRNRALLQKFTSQRAECACLTLR